MSATNHDRLVAAQQPLLSVVVVICGDTLNQRANTSALAGCLEALRQQHDPPALEVIVPHHQLVAGIDEARLRFPEVVFLPAGGLRSPIGRGASREHHDELRARGIAVARGSLVALTEDFARPDPDWSRAVVQAHRNEHAAVGGAIENGIDRALNWAVYFCDFVRYLNPVPAGAARTVSDVNVCFRRDALETIAPVWRETFREPEVNRALLDGGQRLVLCPEIVVYLHRDDLELGSALREFFVWGRSYGASRFTRVQIARRALYAALSPLLPAVLLLRVAATVARRRRAVRPFLRALPFTAVLTVGWSVGELLGYLTGRALPSVGDDGSAQRPWPGAEP